MLRSPKDHYKYLLRYLFFKIPQVYDIRVITVYENTQFLIDIIMYFYSHNILFMKDIDGQYLYKCIKQEIIDNRGNIQNTNKY